MRHGYKGKKFGQGQDSNQMLTRKLIVNFLTHGKIVTTEAKVKYLKGRVDRVITLAKKNTTASKNRLLTILGKPDLAQALLEQSSEVFGSRVSGYTTTRRLRRRAGDAVMEMEMRWVDQVLLNMTPKKKAVTAKKKATPKKAAVEKKAPAAKKATPAPAAKKVVATKKEK